MDQQDNDYDDAMPPPPRKRHCAAEMLSQEEIAPVVTALRHAFGLELFGFDILVSCHSKELFVVDVNYFPSYKEVSNFPSLLAKYLTQRAIQGRKQVSPFTGNGNNSNMNSTR
jgi:inositol-1,3,4-trisphosphate 5/6-kinase/inositol-tetrakisphosphate 1-kinase